MSGAGSKSRYLQIDTTSDDLFKHLPQLLAQASLKIKSADPASKVIEVEAGIGLNSWGETVSATFVEEGPPCVVLVTSTPKRQAGTPRHDAHFENLLKVASERFGSEKVRLTKAKPPVGHMAPDRAKQIRDQVEKLPGLERFFGRKEFKELPAVLWDDEEVVDIIQGIYARGSGLLVSTDRRLIFMDKGLVYGLKVEDFPYDKMTSIQYETGMLFGTVTIFASGNKAVISNVAKGVVRDFAEGVRDRIGRSTGRPSDSASQQSHTSPMSVADEIEKLAGLKDQGIVSEEEFTAKKKQLLGL